MVDLNDFSYKMTTRHGKPVKNKVYRHTCNSCGADRGYQTRSFNTKSCNKCAKKGLKLDPTIKLRMSMAATKRYNDPTWQPKAKKAPFVGQRKKVYKSLISPQERKIRKTMRNLLRQKLKNRSLNKVGYTFDILGYGSNELIKHLESLFQPGMSWDNYGLHGWHIDHIVPDSWFIYSASNDQGFKDSWGLSNLQPMWATSNLSKGARFAGGLV